MHVAHRQVRPLYEHGKVDLGAAREVLDIAVAAVLATGDGARALRSDAGPLGTARWHLGTRGWGMGDEGRDGCESIYVYVKYEV